MSYKKERVEKAIERELSLALLHEVKDERLSYVTITKVHLTNDLSIATVYYTVLGNLDQRSKTSELLNEAKGFVKNSLAKKIKIRKMPDLIFKYDSSYEEGNKIEDILRSLNKLD